MLKGKTIACVIPARLTSTRFPRKILALLQGKPLIQWVWEAATQVSFFDRVVFAVDDPETGRVIEGFGGRYHLTDVNHRSGTERLVQLQREGRVQADVWVNWQADEPFLTEDAMRDLLATIDRDDVDVWTLKKRMRSEDHIHSPHVVKVVADATGTALYFSRSPIPYYPPEAKEKIYYKHIGLYAFQSRALEKIAHFSPHYLEEAEKLEQINYLAHGLRVSVQTTEHEGFGIDIPEHLAAAEERLLQNAAPLL